MAEGTVTQIPPFVDRLSAALSKLLPDSEIGHEHVRAERYRFMVVSSAFEEMGHPERQRKVWDAAEKVLTRDEIRNVAMIITMAASEVGR